MEGTTFSLDSTARPEAMADVPGVCELPLTRAVVHYRDLHEVDSPGGRIQDIGLALVLEGRFASSAEVLDLGSSSVKTLDLSSELVVLDWVYGPTLKHVSRLLVERARGAAELDAAGRLESYSFQMALGLLGRLGYGPLTRPTILRIGFRDICRDLDFHEGTAVRIVLGDHRVARAHLDYDANSLVFSTPSPEPDVLLEAAVLETFPDSDVLRLSEAHNGGSVRYQVRLSLPASLTEAREELRTVRRGLGALLARFEAERFEGIEQHLATFGSRDTLSQLHVRERRMKVEALRTRHNAGGGTVH
ncbi:MAG TPA: hypothetical protein EYQ64_11460 [Gemmatimonadetes bacterium]|nr:hypothetical protein [Gemmatimonadota bacterium]